MNISPYFTIFLSTQHPQAFMEVNCPSQDTKRFEVLWLSTRSLRQSLFLAYDGDEMSEPKEMATERLKDIVLNIRLSSGDGKDRFQVEILKPGTDEVIRRFPPDESSKITASIKEMN